MMNSEESWVTIKIFTYSHEAMILRGRLESEGIPCFLQDELTIQVMPFHSNALGGVKLQVRGEDVEAAMKILEEVDGPMPDAPEDYLPEEEVDAYGRPLPEKYASRKRSYRRCPYCSSKEVDKKNLSPEVFAFCVMLLGFPLPFIRRKYYCYDCQREFRLR